MARLYSTPASLALSLLLAHPARAQRPAAPLDTIRVTSRASAAAAATRSVEVLTREDIDRHPVRSLAELVGFALGADVQTRSPAQADIALRGSSFNQVVILVDGVRVSDVQSGHYALDLAVPTAMIERIEVLRGAGSALYGSDAVGGIVNIVTRTDASGQTLAARGGSFGGASASGAAFGEAGAYGLRAAADIDRSDGHRHGTDYRVAQLRASAERATQAGRVIVDAGLGARKFGAADFYGPYDSDETTRSTTAGVRLVPRDDARVAMGAALHVRRHTDLYTLIRDNPSRYQNQHTSRESGGEATVRATIAPSVHGALGAEVLDARLRSARLGDHVQSRAGAYGELSAGDARHALLDLGLRGDRLSDEGAFLSPSAALAIALTPRVQMRASVSRGFRAPTWTERYYVDPANVADSSLAVERFWSHEVGLRGLLPGGLAGDIALFERRARDLIDWAKPAGAGTTVPWRTRNFASAVYRGVEASVRAPSLLGVDWTLRGSGLRFDASVEPGTVGKYALRPVTRSAGLSASLPLRGGALLGADVQRARRTGEADHAQVDARFSVPAAGARLSLDFINLTNTDYLDASGKPVAPRSLFAGVSWTR